MMTYKVVTCNFTANETRGLKIASLINEAEIITYNLIAELAFYCNVALNKGGLQFV
jgi:hypothetical protein